MRNILMLTVNGRFERTDTPLMRIRSSKSNNAANQIRHDDHRQTLISGRQLIYICFYRSLGLMYAKINHRYRGHRIGPCTSRDKISHHARMHMMCVGTEHTCSLQEHQQISNRRNGASHSECSGMGFAHMALHCRLYNQWKAIAVILRSREF